MIPFLDLKAQYLSIKDDVDAAVLKVLASAQYVLGDEVVEFEREFADYCGTNHAIAVNTGTSALHAALLALGIGPGDEVITVPFTFIATTSAICYTGATPVFVDVEPVSLTMDPLQVEAAITPRTKAIIPVHLYGQMADMEAIQVIAERYDLPVVEDACQAHGALYAGRRAGSFGAMGCFSFYPGKNLGACGEGGIIVTDDDGFAKTLRMLRDWGQEERYKHVLKGFNYRMDGIQAAILRVKLRHLEQWTKARRDIASTYNGYLSPLRDLVLPRELADRRHVYHVYAVRSRERDDLRRRLADQGIQTGLHYPIPVHLQPAHRDLNYGPGDFPVSEAAAQQVLSLPIYPEMSIRDAERVAAAVEEINVIA
jgi:dTDP-4-amino-4,6-dideoxygalactose transaminase